jgi:hypothetical protein
MNETITGLALIVALACLVFLFGFFMLLGMLWKLVLWAQTQEVPPERGQVWNQHGSRLYVVSVTGLGKDKIIRLRSYAYEHKNEWNESVSAWKARIKANHLYLMPKETQTFRKLLEKETPQ